MDTMWATSTAIKDMNFKANSRPGVVNVEFTSPELLVMIQEATDVLKTP